MEIFADLTFWQLVLIALVALPVLAIVLVASAAIVGFVLWWTIKIAFFGAIMLILVMAVVAFARLFGAA
jgi:hypothetical protein